MAMNKYLSIIILDINGLKAPIKRQGRGWVGWWDCLGWGGGMGRKCRQL